MHVCFIYPFNPQNSDGFGIRTFLSHYLMALSENGINISLIYPKSQKIGNNNKKIVEFQAKDNQDILRIIKLIDGKKRIDLIELADFSGWGNKVLKQVRIPVVLRSHSPSFLIDELCPHKKPIFSWNERRLEKKKFKLAREIIFPNKKLREMIKKEVELSALIKILPYGFFKSKQGLKKKTLSVQSRYLKAIYVGRLEELKNIETLVKAVIYANEDLGERVHLTLVGPDTSYRGFKGYQDYIKRKLIKQRISWFRFTGMMNYQSVARLYQKHDVLVMPSKHEALGFVVIEAMSYGLPVIVSKAGMGEGLVDNGKTGLIYWPVESKKALAGKLALLCRQPSLIRKYGLAGKKKIESDLRQKKILAKNINYYQEIIERY